MINIVFHVSYNIFYNKYRLEQRIGTRVFCSTNKLAQIVKLHVKARKLLPLSTRQMNCQQSSWDSAREIEDFQCSDALVATQSTKWHAPTVTLFDHAECQTISSHWSNTLDRWAHSSALFWFRCRTLHRNQDSYQFPTVSLCLYSTEGKNRKMNFHQKLSFQWKREQVN